MNKALLYVRVSSKEQEDGYSLDAQEKLGYEYAGRKNLKIVRLWKVSESAWKQERKAFGQMVDFAKRHKEIEHIIFDVLDRMTRNDFDKLKIHRLIRQHGKTIHFSRSNKIINSESGPDEEFMFDIEAAVAKKLSNDISRKAAMGMREKAEQGVYPSVAPIGYLNNQITHQIDIDPERAPHIQRMFALMATGNYSLAMIRNILTEEGFRSKKGCVVSKNGVGTFINNPVYYGAFRWNGKMYQGSHVPLITKELFDKAQAVMHGRYHPVMNKRGFAFNNLLCCSVCGCKVIGEIKKARFIYYHCTFSKGRHDGKHYTPEKRLAEIMEEPVRQITLSGDIADWLVEALREAQKDSTRFQIKQMGNLKQEYVQIKSRLSRLYDAKFDGEIGGEMFKAKEIEYNDQLVEIRGRMERAEGLNPNFYEDGRQTLELSKRLYPLYVKSNYEEKAKILKLVASNYTLDDVTVGYKYRKPFSYFYEKGSRTKWLPGNKRETKNYSIEFIVSDCPNKITKRYLFVDEFKAFQDRKFRAEQPSKRYVNPIRKALRWQAILDRESGLTKAMLAKRLGRSRVNVTQYVNLIRLPDWIQKKILNTTGVSERALRPLIQIQNERVLKAAFEEVLDQAVSPQKNQELADLAAS